MNPIIEVALFTTDVQRLAQFYEQLLGIAPAAQSPGMAVFQVGAVQLLLHHKEPPQPAYASNPDDPPNEDHIALAVPQVDTLCGALGSHGLAVDFAPRDYPWGRSAYVRDPDGRLVELHQADLPERSM